MNRLGDQFFSCTGFALNQYCGIGRCDSFNLFEHGFECRALAYDSLELLLVAKPECFEVPHNSAAVTGLLLASYTGVLIGATAIPVWSENRRLLPAHFLTSGLGCAAGILELAGFLIPATQILGFIASGIETLIELKLLVRKHSADAPLHQGRS